MSKSHCLNTEDGIRCQVVDYDDNMEFDFCIDCIIKKLKFLPREFQDKIIKELMHNLILEFKIHGVDILDISYDAQDLSIKIPYPYLDHRLDPFVKKLKEAVRIIYRNEYKYFNAEKRTSCTIVRFKERKYDILPPKQC